MKMQKYAAFVQKEQKVSKKMIEKLYIIVIIQANIEAQHIEFNAPNEIPVFFYNSSN